MKVTFSITFRVEILPETLSDNIKRNLTQKGILLGSMDQKAKNRPLWRELIRRKSSSATMNSK